MPLDVSAQVEVGRPQEVVADYMTDPANDPEWIGGVKEARLVSDPPLRVGSRVGRAASFLGRRIGYLNEITELEPTRLDMKSVEAPFPMRITYEFEPREGGTTVRNRVRGGGGLFSAGSPSFAPIVRRSIRRDLERLRDVLESRPAQA